MVARNAPRWMKMLAKHGFVPTPAWDADELRSPCCWWLGRGQGHARLKVGFFQVNQASQ